MSAAPTSEQLRKFVFSDPELRNALTDPISFEIIEDPVIAADGVTYSRASIEMWFDRCERQRLPLTSPMTNERLANKSLQRNLALIPFLDRAKALASKSSNGNSGSSSSSSASAAAEPAAGLKDLSPAVFTELDRVMALPGIQDLKLKPAQVVALGMESHGKSTLLERLIGLPLFPKDKVRCTTCIIRVHLRRGPAQLASVCIRNRESLEESEKVDVALEKICVEVRRRMEIIRRSEPDRVISNNHEVLIAIQLPFVPNLDIVDLPGLVAANTGKKIGRVEQDLSSATFDLAESVITTNRGNSIFLLVVDIRMQINLCRAAELVRIHEIERQTIGVYTKLDVFVSEDDDDDVVVNKLRDTDLLSTHGWLACSNRMPPAGSFTRDIDRLGAMEDAEERLLQTSAAGGNGRYLAMGKAGMPLIRKAVQDLFEDFLCHFWIPSIEESLLDVTRQKSAENAALGLPMLHPPDRNQTEIIQALKKPIAKFIRGYNVAVFEPVDVAVLLSAVQGKLAETAKQSVRQLKLINCPRLWAAVVEYDAFVCEKEQEWTNASTQRQQRQQRINYSYHQPQVPPPVIDPIMTAVTIKERAVAILKKVIDELCTVITSADTSARIRTSLIASVDAIKLADETQFEGLGEGKYMNFDRFPALKKTLLAQVNNKLNEASASVHAELTASLDTFAAKRLNFTIPKHSIVGTQHINELRWSEEGKAYTHLLIDEFMEVASRVLPATLQSVKVVNKNFEGQNGVNERTALLQTMLVCLQVRASLAQIKLAKPVRVFHRLPPPVKRFEKVSIVPLPNQVYQNLQVVGAGDHRMNGVYTHAIYQLGVSQLYRNIYVNSNTNAEFLFKLQVKSGQTYWFISSSFPSHPNYAAAGCIDYYYAPVTVQNEIMPAQAFQLFPNNAQSVAPVPTIQQLYHQMINLSSHGL